MQKPLYGFWLKKKNLVTKFIHQTFFTGVAQIGYSKRLNSSMILTICMAPLR